MTRRTFLASPAAALAANGTPAKLPACAFSKHFQWTASFLQGCMTPTAQDW